MFTISFYAAYKQGIKSQDYADIPILGGVFPVAFCLASNLVSLCIIVIKRYFILKIIIWERSLR